MKKLSVGQRKSLGEFFTNAAVAWLSAGIIAPVFTSRKASDLFAFVFWGLFSTSIFLGVSLFFTKGVKT